VEQRVITSSPPPSPPPKRKRARREEILLYICDYANERSGPTPSINEIAKHFGVAYSTVYHHVMRLGLDGKLLIRDGKLVVVGSEWFEPSEISQIR